MSASPVIVGVCVTKISGLVSAAASPAASASAASRIRGLMVEAAYQTACPCRCRIFGTSGGRTSMGLPDLLLPEFLQSLGGDGQRRAQLLGEERHAQLFEKPAEFLEVRVVAAGIVVLLRARLVHLPEPLHR